MPETGVFPYASQQNRSGLPLHDHPSQGPAIPQQVALQRCPLPFRQTYAPYDVLLLSSSPRHAARPLRFAFRCSRERASFISRADWIISVLHAASLSAWQQPFNGKQLAVSGGWKAQMMG